MRSFRASFFRIVCLFVLAFSGDVAMAQMDLGAMMEGIADPNNWFYTRLTARQSTTSGGSGQVSLLLVDMSGAEYTTFGGNDMTPLVNAYNPSGNPTALGSTASMVGFAPIYMPGVETELAGMYISSYAYFKGTAVADDGSWFAGWSYSNGGTDMAADSVFKILPSNQSGASHMTSAFVYATFKPVLLGDYLSELGTVEATPGAQTMGAAGVYVSGQSIDEADFNVPVVVGADWVLDSWYYVEEEEMLFAEVVYTAPSTIVVGEEYKTTITFSTKAGSTVTVPVGVRAVPADAEEATLKIGETEQNGNWVDMLAAAKAATGSPIVLTLNKDIQVSTTQVIDKTLTLNLNGYNLTSSETTPLKINGGQVTLAYCKYGGNIVANEVAVEVAAGELTLEGGNLVGSTAVWVKSGATLLQNGATLDGLLLNAGTTIIKDGFMNGNGYAVRSTGSLTIQGGTINAATAIYVETGTANLKKGTAYGSEVSVLSKGNTTIEKLFVMQSDATGLSVVGGTTTVNCGKFSAPTPIAKSAGTLDLVSGYFQTNAMGVAVPQGKQLWNVTSGVEYTQGYTYYLGVAPSCVCKIGTTPYATLEEALAYANNNSTAQVTILMQNNYTLPAGYYTLPANAMLIVPMSLEQETGYTNINRYSNNSVTQTAYVQPTEFMRLTLASGANLDVRGSIEVTGSQLASDQSYAAVPYGPYGHLVMEEGSHMTLGNGSLLRVWGFMTGKGETDARRGSVVREQFQMGDWKGGTTSFGMLSDWRHVFPISQYYIQSVESPVKYHPGAVLSSTTSVSAAAGGLAITAMANDIKIVGVAGRDEAMFLMDDMADAENTWVRKWYDVENDIQTYEVNSSAHIGSMVLDLGKLGTTPLEMNSGWFVLPITNNMKIHLLSGSMDFTQSTSLLPGAEVEIDKESTISISTSDDVVSGSLYLYDADDWGAYAYDDSGSKRAKAVKYTPSWNGQPTARNLVNLKDATINVHGTFDTADGYVFTSESGANIFSTNEDAGTFRFSIAAAQYAEDVYQVEGRSNYVYKVFSSAQLKNADGSYATTTGTEEGKSYCYMNGRWTLMDIDPDDECFFVDNYGQHYIKPSEFVAINATKTDGVISGNPDHTYSDAAGTGRLFILLPDNCQWWEVENVNNLYHCIHPNNDTYYYWDNDEEAWIEKRFVITWNNWDGTPLTLSDGSEEYSVTYGTMAEFLGANPTREPNVDYTYDFTGWSPALAPVTSDVTYTATYNAVQRKYTIIFQKEGGQEIERHFLTRDEMPVCEDEPTKIGHILQWEPSIAAVTGDQTYTATWLEEKPATYTITWKNYNGTTLMESEVAADAVASVVEASYTKATPYKPFTTEYNYVFDHWNPAIAPATANATYTAVFREEGITYDVTFLNEDGNVIEQNQYAYGATPVCSQIPSKANTAEFSYAFAWEPQIQTVTGAATYQASFTPTRNKYKVTLLCNNATYGSVTGAGLYDYGTSVGIRAIPASDDYEFVEWQEDHSKSATHSAFTLTENVTYTAIFREKEVTYSVSFENEDGSLIETNTYVYGETPVCSQVPTKANTAEFSYEFSWTPAIQSVTSNATYRATFTPTRNQYTVTVLSTNDAVCSLSGAGTFDYGTSVVVGVSMTDDNYEFVEWQEDHSTSATRSAFTLTENVTFTAVVREKEPQGISELIVDLGDILTIDTPTEVDELTILSNGTVSGQLTATAGLTVSGEAKFCLTLNAAARTWYAVAVPWQVDAESGISVVGAGQLALGTDIDVVYYDGASRAANGKIGSNWRFLENEADKTLYPGRLYMIYLAQAQTALCFSKKTGAPLFTSSLAVAAYDASASLDANWNGIANPATFYAYLNAGVQYAQSYDPISKNYPIINMSTTTLVVGQPVFVQAPAAKTVIANASSYSAVAARRSDARLQDIRCAVELSKDGVSYDRIFVQTAEDKAAEYVIGQDLAKVGISSFVPQMWIDRYGAELCVNTISFVLGSADYPISIYVPADGQYQLSLTEATGLTDKSLYLTKDGLPVWNFANGAYVADLESGSTARYALRIADVENVATSYGAVSAEGSAEAYKLLVDEVVYIIRGTEVYTVTGQKVTMPMGK